MNGNFVPFEWYQSHENENLILSFKGEFNQELIKAILALTQGRAGLNKESHLVRTRIFGAIVECLQNICKHGVGSDPNASMKPGIILLAVKKGKYVISAGNMITEDQKAGLSHRLEKVNGLNHEALRAYQKETLKRLRYEKNSDTNIGLISLARKASEKLKYAFQQMEDNSIFYSLEVCIASN